MNAIHPVDVFQLKLEGFSTNDLGHDPWGVFQKALKIMDHRKTQAGQEKTIFPLTAGQVQHRAIKVFGQQKVGSSFSKGLGAKKAPFSGFSRVQYEIGPTCNQEVTTLL